MFTGHININRKDVHASMILINGKYSKNMGIYHGFEKMKPQLCFFLKTSSNFKPVKFCTYIVV